MLASCLISGGGGARHAVRSLAGRFLCDLINTPDCHCECNLHSYVLCEPIKSRGTIERGVFSKQGDVGLVTAVRPPHAVSYRDNVDKPASLCIVFC